MFRPALFAIMDLQALQFGHRLLPRPLEGRIPCLKKRIDGFSSPTDSQIDDRAFTVHDQFTVPIGQVFCAAFLEKDTHVKPLSNQVFL